MAPFSPTTIRAREGGESVKGPREMRRIARKAVEATTFALIVALACGSPVSAQIAKDVPADLEEVIEQSMEGMEERNEHVLLSAVQPGIKRYANEPVGV